MILSHLALLEILPLPRHRLIVLIDHLQPLIDRNVEQVLNYLADGLKRDCLLEVGINQMPKIVHVCRLIRCKVAVHETCKEEFMWVVLAIFEAEIFVAEEALFDGGLVILYFAIIVQVDCIGN